MQRRTIVLVAAAVVAVLAGTAAFVFLRPAPPTPAPAPAVAARPPAISTAASDGLAAAGAAAATGTPAPGAPAATAAKPSAPVSAPKTSPQAAVTNGPVFAFVSLAEPAAAGGAVLTVDFAMISPVDEMAPTPGRNEITNDTVEAVRLTATKATTVDAGPTGGGTMDLGTWLAKRAAADKTGTTLSRSPYWIELRNGRIVRLRLQQLP
jgi:hypothetical protein